MVRKRRRRRRRYLRSAYLAYAVLLGAHCLLYWVLTSKKPARGFPDPGTAPMADRGDLAPVRPAAIRTSYRPIYPHSVIRGGAYSVAELDAALRVDPVAAAHYAVFDRTQTRIARAPDSTAVYVSYRQGNRIYWTRRKVRLAADETLLTDGVHTSRARCGNRISLTPPEPAQTGEPDSDLDLPEPPPANPDDPAAGPQDVFSLPMVVNEIFPALLGNWLSGGAPGGSVGAVPDGAGGPGGMSFPTSHLESPPPGFAFPLLPEVTLPPPMPIVWPVDFTTMPLPPVGPGLGWIQPEPLPGGFVPVSATGPPAGGSAPAPSSVALLPPFSGITPIPGIIPIADIAPTPNIPPSPALSRPAPPPSAATRPPPPDPSPPDLLPPDDPLPFTDEVPEPATAALLLCGAAILSCRRLQV